MEAVYYAARANLRRLLGLYPQWTHSQYAQALGMSRGWVKKWKKRLQEAEPEDEQVLSSRSRARMHPPERISQVVVDRILQMRDEPPEGLRRTPGPKALLYYLPRDEQIQGERLPRLPPDDLPHPAASRTHRPSAAPHAGAAGASRTDEVLATRF